jgi:hypothetical protein
MAFQDQQNKELHLLRDLPKLLSTTTFDMSKNSFKTNKD